MRQANLPPGYSNRAVRQYRRKIGGREFTLRRARALVSGSALTACFAGFVILQGVVAGALFLATLVLLFTCGWAMGQWTDFWQSRDLNFADELPEGLQEPAAGLLSRYDGAQFRVERHEDDSLIYVRYRLWLKRYVLVWDGLGLVNVDRYIQDMPKN